CRRALRERAIPITMARAPARQLTTGQQVCSGKFSNRFQQSITSDAVARLDRYERPVDEAGKDFRECVWFQAVAAADRDHRIQAPTTRKDAESIEQRSFVGAKQLVTPVERGVQRLLAWRSDLIAAGEQAESIVESNRKLLKAEGANPSGCQLDGQRDPVETRADVFDEIARAGVEAELRRRRARPH